MFDELEKETEDMFAQTDATGPQVSSPTQPPASLPAEPSAQQVPVAPVATPSPMQERINTLASAKRPFPWKAIALFTAIVVVIGLAFFLSMRILKSKTPTTPEAPDTSLESSLEPVVEETTDVTESSIPIFTTESEITDQAAALPTEELDSDKDGLSDMREAQLGTNPNSSDTDADGLFDKEEVDVYKTNPLNSDSDGDTFLDGAEVKGGYDPNGPGKLLVIPQE